MQLFNRYDNEKRTLYYWSKQYAEQLEEGNPYKQLKKCITINILDFSFLPNDRYHSTFHLYEDHTGITLSDDIEIHFLELSKIDTTEIPTKGGLLNWLLFLKSENKQIWEVLKMHDAKLGKAMTALEFLSQDKEARRLYEMRQKALHDEASMLAGAREEAEKKGREEGRTEGHKEGLQEGLEKGETKGTKKVAKALLQKGMDIQFISEITKLTEDEIIEIKTGLAHILDE